jgi:DNA-binding GntR family transcriptional regulator
LIKNRRSTLREPSYPREVGELEDASAPSPTVRPRLDAGNVTYPVKPTARAKLGAEVARLLRDNLMAGVYPPNQRMGVEELASQLDVSTMPVREALIMLANEGLLVNLPRRGFRVANLGLQDMEDVFEVHAWLAGRLAERATYSLQPDDLGELRRLQDDIGRLSAVDGSTVEIEETNFRFHRVINKAANSKRLEWYLRAATRFVPRHFYEAVPGWVEESVAQHTPILAAFEAKDGEAARRLMEQHVATAGRLVVAHLEAVGWTRSAQPTGAATRSSPPEHRDR